MTPEELRTLTLFNTVDSSPKTNQRQLARELDVSLGLTNTYFQRVLKKGWVRAKQVKPRRWLYFITPQGALEKSRLSANTTMPFSVNDNVDHPLSLYAASKKANELMAHTYSHLYNLPTTGLRFFTVYGPWGRPDMALFKFTKAILANKPIQVFNYGKHRRDFTYIDDIVEGLIRVLDRPAAPNPKWSGESPDSATSKAPWRVYNIGNNNPIDLMDYIETLENALGKTAKKEFLPLQPGDIPDTYADVKALVDQFYYKPSTTVEEGVPKFTSWYLEYTTNHKTQCFQ